MPDNTLKRKGEKASLKGRPATPRRSASFGVSEATTHAVPGTWTFDRFELDGKREVLRGTQEALNPGTKPWLILLALLQSSGGGLSKDKLMSAAWDDQPSEDAFRRAMSDLRKLLGDDQQRIVVRDPNGRFRIGVAVDFTPWMEPQQFAIYSGMQLPGREGWTVSEKLGRDRTAWAWMADNDQQGSIVVKFAEGATRRRSIQREFEVSEILRTSLPRASWFVRVLGQYDDERCHYIESEVAGQDLRVWVAERQSAEGLSADLALSIMLQVASAVAEFHELGWVHNDLRPENIMVAPGGTTGSWHAKLTGFKHSVQLSDECNSAPPGKALLPRSMYRPPEAPNGTPAMTGTDVYALGILLFQMLRGDFSVSPTGAWHSLLPGRILQQDIESAVAQDSRSRLGSVAEFAEKIRTAEARQLKHDLHTARRKALFVAVAAMAVMAVVLTILAFVFHAKREEQDAAAIDAFMTHDLLREMNPANGKGVNETLHQAISNILPRIESAFAGRPLLAAKVHEEIAEALANQADLDEGGAEFDAAARDFRAAGKDAETIEAELDHALLALKTQKPGTLDSAKNILDRQLPAIAALRHPPVKLIFAQLNVEGMIALTTGDISTAKAKFKRAVEITAANSSVSPELRLPAKARYCFMQLHTGEAGAAIPCFTELISRYKTMYGENSGPVLNLQVNLAQAYVMDGQFARALQEANGIYPALVEHLGANNPLTLVVLGVRPRAEAGLNQFDAAIHDELVLAESAQRADPTNPDAIAAFSDAGVLECQQGNTVLGESHAREALAIASTGPPSVGFIGMARYSVAFCILARTSAAPSVRLAEAGQLLKSIDIPSVASAAGDPAWGANVMLAKAELAFAQKQYSLASNELAEAKAAFSGNSPTNPASREIRALEEKLKRACPSPLASATAEALCSA